MNGKEKSPDKPKTPISERDQMAMAKKVAETNHAFANCRRLGEGFKIEEFLITEKENRVEFNSPAGATDKFMRYASDWKIVINILSKYVRDGNITAYNELLKALRDQNYEIKVE